MSLVIENARVVFGDGRPALPNARVRIEGETITSVDGDAPGAADSVLDARGRVLMPAFVDCHTHATWAGDRLDEWEAKGRGASYLEILARGGGILSTVRAVRAASEDLLAHELGERLDRRLATGTTTIEVKSGYGLDTENELKQLRAIARAVQGFSGTVVTTALLGHAIDPDVRGFVDRVISETLPAVHDEFPGVFVDAYCEQGSWSLADCRRLLERAVELGHPVRLHADQFHALGGVGLALELGARSVDHLEATSAEDLVRLAKSESFGVMLPATGFHEDDRYANGRAFLDAGGRLALATNQNPGSSPTGSMPFVIALGVRKLGLSPTEAITATTATPATLLGLSDRGSIAVGKRADLILLRHTDERLLAFELGGDPVESVMCGGKLR